MNARRVPVRLAAIALLAVSPFVAVACGDDDDGGGTTTSAAESATTVSEGSGDSGGSGDVTIVIDDVAFQTPDVTVEAGQSVTWDNQDNQPHTATGENSSFATDRINAGESKTVTFDEVGTFPYICSFHPFMKGTVTVE
jgi:plastocyanin